MVDGKRNIIPLSGEWDIQSTDGKYSFKGTMPGSFFHELEKRGFFGPKGIFWRKKNRECLQFANQDIMMRRKFVVPLEFAKKKGMRIFLEADGLDTLAAIHINGKLIGKSLNMHRPVRINVGRWLKPGTNNISILFADTLEYIRKKKEKRELWHTGTADVNYPGFNLIRKSHCSYGWDWGPQVPDIGIWRDIRIVRYDRGRIRNIHVQQGHLNGRVTLKIMPDIEIWTRARFQLRVICIAPDGMQMVRVCGIHQTLKIEISSPLLWWPNGLGGQPLYRMKFELIVDGIVVHTQEKRIGLRTIMVDRSKDKWGSRFVFVVNGIPVFARGADYVPEDIILSRVTLEKTRGLLESAKSANFNSIRVWGGGVYPSDQFFDLCDELGLLVWQDLMFACAYYDIKDGVFRNNIVEEVRKNLLRIRHHASLSLICGNNEMEWATMSWKISDVEQYKKEYMLQYEELFPSIIKEVCPEIFYWPASPSSGGGFIEPNSPNHGDCHYWDVWHGNKDFIEYTKHYFRFMSEFGFESFPSIKTIGSFTLKKERNILSSVVVDHQRGSNGNEKTLAYIGKYFKEPKDFESLIYLSQISQSEALRIGVEHWRRSRGRCMGAIYWQLNDNWPGASWSSIDYYGRWKAAHYVMKQTFAHLLVSCVEQGNRVELYLSNEGRQPIRGILSWSLKTFTGNILCSGKKRVSVSGMVSRRCENLILCQWLDTNEKRRTRYLSFSFAIEGGGILRKSHLFSSSKYLKLADPRISYSLKKSADNFILMIESKSFARFVWIDLKGYDAVFSENCFDMEAGEIREISFKLKNAILAEVLKAVVVRSLFDSFL